MFLHFGQGISICMLLSLVFRRFLIRGGLGEQAFSIRMPAAAGSRGPQVQSKSMGHYLQAKKVE
ncbi:hypothetical protein ATY79_19975 [Rhizobium sp. R693]|nr:hypothetical protein ATY79_19975 [Rhizobium sp. R693]